MYQAHAGHKLDTESKERVTNFLSKTYHLPLKLFCFISLFSGEAGDFRMMINCSMNDQSLQVETVKSGNGFNTSQFCIKFMACSHELDAESQRRDYTLSESSELYSAPNGTNYFSKQTRII